MSHTAEIIAVGTELLLGNITNTNASEISRALSVVGVNVFWHTVVGDNPERLREALREADALSGEIDTSKLEELLGSMDGFFDELAALSDDELCERIRSIAAEHGITLNDAQTQQLADLFRKIQSLGGSGLAERMQDLPETVEKIRETGENALSTAGTVWDSVRGFLQRVGKTLSALFGD